MIDIKSADDLLEFIITQASSGNKDWFGFAQQKIIGIYMACEIARIHADKLTPEQCVEYATNLNNAIFSKMIRAKSYV